MLRYANNPRILNELKNKRLFIFDMDGTIYLEDKTLPNAVDLIARINNHENKRMIYFTNNASKNPAYYLDKLNLLGFPASKEQILTSADVLIKFLKSHRKNKTIYLLGTPYLEDMFIQHGITLVRDSVGDGVLDVPPKNQHIIKFTGCRGRQPLQKISPATPI